METEVTIKEEESKKKNYEFRIKFIFNKISDYKSNEKNYKEKENEIINDLETLLKEKYIVDNDAWTKKLGNKDNETSFIRYGTYTSHDWNQALAGLFSKAYQNRSSKFFSKYFSNFYKKYSASQDLDSLLKDESSKKGFLCKKNREILLKVQAEIKQNEENNKELANKIAEQEQEQKDKEKEMKITKTYEKIKQKNKELTTCDQLFKTSVELMKTGLNLVTLVKKGGEEEEDEKTLRNYMWEGKQLLNDWLNEFDQNDWSETTDMREIVLWIREFWYAVEYVICREEANTNEKLKEELEKAPNIKWYLESLREFCGYMLDEELVQNK